MSASDFADEGVRRSWIEEKNMRVFQMRNINTQSIALDVFVEEPFSFSEEYANAWWDEISGVRVPFVSYEQLMRLKRESGRPQDLADIDQLELMFGKRD